MSQPTLFDEPEADAPLARAGNVVKPDPPQPSSSSPLKEPQRPGASWVERWQVQEELAELLGFQAGGSVSEEELFRFVRGSLYVLTTDELLAVGRLVPSKPSR